MCRIYVHNFDVAIILACLIPAVQGETFGKFLPKPYKYWANDIFRENLKH